MQRGNKSYNRLQRVKLRHGLDLGQQKKAFLGGRRENSEIATPPQEYEISQSPKKQETQGFKQ